MSIRQNLRILNKPISELAMLPQETIMTMAQSGQIPVAFVAPILAEKAEASQRAVEAEAMMAQEQMPPGSVIEKIIAQNAANETQANMPMMAPPMPEAQDNMPMMGAQMPQMSQMPQPEDVGIGALPVPDEMIPGLAGGGIIAFQNRGLVEGQESNMYTGLSEDIAALQAAKEAFVGPNQSVADLIAYNKEAEKRAAERAKSQFNTRLIEAGLLGLGGDSEYFGVNMGRMAPAVKGMSEDTEKQAEAKEARIKSELAAKGIERKEKETTFGQTLADRAGREKIAPEAVRGAREIQAAAKATGAPVPTFTEALRQYSDFATRATGTATLQAAFVGSKKDAAKAVNELLSNNIFKADLKSIQKKQGKEAAEAYKRQRIRETVGLFPGVDPDQVMSVVGGSGAAPSKPSKPTEAEFLKRARPDNPGVSEKDLKDYYKKTYGG
jgi:hypothetical protein